MLMLAAFISAAAAARLPRSYQAQSSVVLLAPRSVAKADGGNPYLSFSPSLTLTADVLSRELMGPAQARRLVAEGAAATYTVTLPTYTTATTGSVLLVTVSGSGRALVETTLQAVTREISTELSRLQGPVRPADRIRATTLAMSPQPTLSISMSARPLVAVVVPAFLLALWIPVVVDGRAARRRLRRQALRAAGAVPVGGGHKLPVRPAPAGQVPGAGYRTGPGNGTGAVNGNGSGGHGRSPRRRAGVAR
ncbi:MAG TPA: hypothetical protein VIX86_13360 [Streptosporangiaceae bacterium]